MKSFRTPINTGPFFVCLTLLLVNDLFLKDTYGNWITGKLSDFCGLVVFSLFFSWVFPRIKTGVHIAVALLFVWWKGPWSQSFIELFSHYVFTINRVVDITDLLALPVLIYSYNLSKTEGQQVGVHPFFPAVLAVFAFCNTSIVAPSQRFDDAQYLLLNRPVAEHWGGRENEYLVHPMDSMYVVEIRQISIDRFPVLDDELHERAVLKNLEYLFLGKVTDGGPSDSSRVVQMADTLFPSGVHGFDVIHEEHTDRVTFSGPRMHGAFERTDTVGITLIKGAYDKGLKCGRWQTFNGNGKLIIEKTFRDGLLVDEKILDAAYYDHQTVKDKRSETFTRVYFNLAILLLLAGVSGIVIIKRYRKHGPHTGDYSYLWNGVMILLYPAIIVVFCVALVFLLPTFGRFSFPPFELAPIYVVSAVLTGLFVYRIKRKTFFDLMLFSLIVASLTVFLMESNYLWRLIDETQRLQGAL